MVAGSVLLLGNIPYIRSIRRGDTRPNRVTWGIWTTIGFILLGSSYSLGATNTLWLIMAQVVSQLVITCYAFKYSRGKWQRLDRICIAGAGLSLFLWWRSGSPLVALVMNIAMDMLGAVPTITKIYDDPNSEDITFWVMSFTSAVVNLLTIENFDRALIIFPLYLFRLNTLVLMLLTRSKWSRIKK